MKVDHRSVRHDLFECLVSRLPVWLKYFRKENVMKRLLLTVLISSFAATAAMADTCKVTAGDKKLAGAALKSFITKCEKDAQASCDAAAADKKLAGAAKASFTKKCVSDAVGN